MAAPWRWAALRRAQVTLGSGGGVGVLSSSAQQCSDGDVHSATGLGITADVQLNCDTCEKDGNAADHINFQKYI